MANKALVAELNLNIKKFTAQLNRAERRAKAMGQKGGRAGGKALGKGLQGGVAGAMTKIASNIVKTLAVAAAAAGAVFARVIQRSTQEAGQIEAAEMRFNILTGDAEKSKQVLTQLRQTAMRTGITFEAMAGNVGKFMAFGFSPEKAMELNKGILDVGGAVGMTNTDMKLLGVALSQVAAKGVGSMEELRQQIAEKGIPIFKALEEQLGVTGAELNKMIQEGKVSADVVLGLFTDVAKGKGPLKDFAGGADKMATTFQGKVGRMKATWGEFLKRFGEPIIEALKPIMDDILIILERMIQNAEEWGNAIAKGISHLENFTDPIATMSESIDGFEKAWDAFTAYAGDKFGNAVAQAYVHNLSLQASLAIRILLNTIRVAMQLAARLITGEIFVALASAAHKFGAILLDAASNLISFIKNKIPDIALFDGLKVNLEIMSNFLSKVAIFFRNIAEGTERISAAVKNPIFNKIANMFNKADKATDITKDVISDQIGKIDVFGSKDALDRLKAILDELKARPKEEQVELGPGEEGPSSPLIPAGGGFALNGRVDQMNNALMGRNAFAVIAIEAQKASAQRDQMIGLLGKVAENTTPLADDGSIGLNGSALGAFA